MPFLLPLETLVFINLTMGLYIYKYVSDVNMILFECSQ